MLDEFGLGALGPASPFALSHGEKRRLSVAAMLILGQRILVLDEPTFGQDQKNTAALMAKLAALNQAGRTIVLITHDIRLVLEHAEQAAVLIEGAVAYIGPPERIFADQELLSRGRLIAPPMVDLSGRLARLDPSFPIVGSMGRMMEELSQRLSLDKDACVVASSLEGNRWPIQAKLHCEASCASIHLR
jgi:energy-coupling factor transport system ATP-binding protein